MRDPHEIIVRPHITEKSVELSYGDPTIQDESQVQRRYTFIVSNKANKIEIKEAIETIYNVGRKSKEDLIEVERVNTIKNRGKKRRVGMRSAGKRPDFKKAIVTLKKGQVLEDYGV